MNALNQSGEDSVKHALTRAYAASLAFQLAFAGLKLLVGISQEVDMNAQLLLFSNGYSFLRISEAV